MNEEQIKTVSQRNKTDNNTSPSSKTWDWIWFSIWTILLLAFLFWIECWWGLLVIPFLFDAYITHFIPWGWWKNIKNPFWRSVMGWCDALIFAAVAMYFIHNYFGQNYVIPSSSLEKSMLTGDYLLVSKMNYGPRDPMTPVHLPMTAHTIPLLNCKSFLEKPQLKYHRNPGFQSIRQNDIVVFNYPSGDTVALGIQEADYYSLCYQIGEQLLPVNLQSLSRKEQTAIFSQQYEAGREFILQNPDKFGKVVYRPVDMRENYVKRCVGLPGQVLQVKKGIVYTDGHRNKQPGNVQYCYDVQLKNPLPEYLCRELNISQEDRSEILNGNSYLLRMPLTQKAYNALKQRPDLVEDIYPSAPTAGSALYPHDKVTGWTANDYGPLWIPAKGKTLQITLDNLPIYIRPIQVYENNAVEVKDGKIFINGQQTSWYTFKMDYYWMMGDNRDNSADSRFWGFVPEDHIVGKPLLIWMSLDKDYGWLDGKIRWGRFFRSVDNIK